jgi:hypothetical protein
VWREEDVARWPTPLALQPLDDRLDGESRHLFAAID